MPIRHGALTRSGGHEIPEAKGGRGRMAYSSRRQGKRVWGNKILAGVAGGISSLLIGTTAGAATTTNAGQAYIDECAAAGVPTPPEWNYENAWHGVNSQWVNNGVLDNEFISGGLTAEVFYYQSTAPLGVCIALPRSTFPAGQTPDEGPPTRIDLLGVICQSSVTGAACFWDHGSPWRTGGVEPLETLLFGDGTVETHFVGGADLAAGNGGVCTDCHRGENVYIMHPETALGLSVPNRMPGVWHEPIVPAGWPENPGPTNLFGPDESESCLACHRAGSPIGGGRFPQVSNQTSQYCGTILEQSFGKTMPMGSLDDDPADHEPYQLLLQACMAPPPPESNPAQKMMSFDGPAEQFWSAQVGTLSTVTDTVTEGAAAMAVNASGYVRLDSSSFNTWELPVVGTQLDMDVYVPPAGQPQPYWLGAVQLYVTVASAQINNYFVGHVELTPGGTGWRNVSFTLPSQVTTALAQQHADVRFGIAVNTPNGAPAVRLDNLHFAGTLSLPPAPPALQVQYNFERGGAWTGLDGAVDGTSNTGAVAFLGFSSMQIDLDGASDGRVWTEPSTSPSPGATVLYRVYIPSGAPISAIQPYVMDANWAWTDSWNTNLPRDAWVTVAVVVPQWATLPLKEIGVKAYLSQPYAGPIYLDAIQW